MKFLLLQLLPFILFISLIQPGTLKKFYHFECATVTYVYVCDSKTSYAYHSPKDCRGLSRCTHEIIKVTESEAKNTYYKRACKLCW